MASLRRRFFLRLGLSAILILHLLCLIVAPQRDSYIGRILGAFMDPYAQFLELEVSWSFFAPEPGPPPIYIDWETLSDSGEVLAQGRLPETQDPYWIRERQNRRILLARFMAQGDPRTEGVMLPFLCRTHRDARSVRLWRVQYTIPGMREIASGERRIGDDRNSERRMASHSFCPELK